jgi:uncharacterized membrane protein
LAIVFGTWTLLVVQWVSILTGAWGTLLLLRAKGSSEVMAQLGMTIMLLYFGVFAAMAFDYHSNVVATMIVPWFLLALERERPMRAVLLFLAILAGKESMGLWLGPLALILATSSHYKVKIRWLASGLGMVGLAWSILVIGAIMPSLDAMGTYAHFDYGVLGKSIDEAPASIIRHPWTLIKALFVDHVGVHNGTAMKLEFWWMMALAGGWAFLMKPRWGLMALPLIAQKMWHDDPGKWTVVAQYGIEFAPLIAIAVPLALMRYNGSLPKFLPWLVVACSLAVTVRFMDRTVAYQDRSRIRIYQSQHYVKDYDIGQVFRILKLIPHDAVVSAQSPAVSHLALRESIYQFPFIRDADHVVLMPMESPYPLDTSTYAAHVRELRSSPDWEIVAESAGIILFKRPRAVIPAP